MSEHAGDLLLAAGAIIALVLGGWLFFLKRDRGQIDADIKALRREMHEMKDEICGKIRGVEDLAVEAKNKAYGIERNYLVRFQDVHDHLGRVELNILAETAKGREQLLLAVTTLMPRSDADRVHGEIDKRLRELEVPKKKET